MATTYQLLVNPRLPESEQQGLQERFERWRQNFAPRNEGGTVMTSSGSRGAPKLVVISDSAWKAHANAFNEITDATAKDRWLCSVPKFHVGGYAIGVRARESGASCFDSQTLEKWNAQKLLQEIDQYKITHLSLVPTQLVDLVHLEVSCPKSVTALFVGGGFLPPDLHAKASQLGWPVWQTYAMTESASSLALCSPSESTMVVLPSWQVRKGTEGILEISGPALFSGYIDSQGGLFRSHEWHSTNDRCELLNLNGATHLRVLGRNDDIIKIMGEQVSLGALQARLESLIRLFPDIKDAAIVALKDQRAGYTLELQAISSSSAIEKFIDHFNSQVAPFERLRSWRAVSSIPRTGIGKLIQSK